jgi:hypothetical protein
MRKEITKVFVSNKGKVYSISEMSDRQEKKWKKEIEGRFRVARDTLIDITIHKGNKEWENLTPMNKRRFIASEVNTQIFNWLGIATSEEMEHMKTKIRQQALEIDSLKVANKTNNPYLESDRMKQILLLALNELDKEVANWTLIKAILNQARDEL